MNRAGRRFFSSGANGMGLMLVVMFLAIAIAAPWLSPLDMRHPGPYKQVGRFSDRIPHPPSASAILGTLPGQYDVYHTIIWGSRNAITFGLTVVVCAFTFGVIYGATAGYLGGMVNDLSMRVTDFFLVIPVIVSTVIIRQLIGSLMSSLGGVYYFDSQLHQMVADYTSVPPAYANILANIDPLLISLILFTWMPYARVINALIIALKGSDFIQAARALGGGTRWVVFRHLIPNSISPVLVLAARDVGSAVLLQATFTFIGLAGNSPWGALLSLGRDWIIGPGGNILTYWWLFLPATLVVILFGVSWNLLGDGISDMFNPRI